MRLPDVLVLGAGGVLGEAWMSGVLAGIEDGAGVDFRRCDTYVGTSAGSIVAARLASGRSPRRPDDLGDPPSDFARDTPEALAEGDGDGGAGDEREAGDGADSPAAPSGRLQGAARGAARLGAWASAPLIGPAIAATTPAGARLRALALARVPAGTNRLTGLHAQVSSWGARFDGRLRIAAVDRATGRRVMFGRPGAPA
ncbi:MAG TPA: patatin-like phospholipase family protein, partial [Solirubrobacteraceae bacterium]|nr:patatin-like phospholipase family protein [Solirubrobacteraceae bacterium]